MARQVIRALSNTPGVHGVAVVTASGEAARFAEQLGATVLREEREAGTAAACTAAVSALRVRTECILIASGDLPLVSVSALEALVCLARRSPLVAIAPDRRRLGTNALLCTPPDVIPLCFGRDSFQRHVAACKPPSELHIVDSDALALDIDDAEDLQELQRRLRAGAMPECGELREILDLNAEAVAP